MLEPTATSFVVSVASTGSLVVLTIPHISPVIKRCFSSNAKYQALDHVYEDEDGKASDESQAAFSDIVKRLTLIVLSILGLALAAVSAVFTLTQHKPGNNSHLIIQQWLQFASWVRNSFFCLLRCSVLTLPIGHLTRPILQHLSNPVIS